MDNNPVNTFVEIHHNDKIVTQNIDTSINEAGVPNSFVKEYGIHIIAFFPPMLDCIECSNEFKVKVKTESKTGAVQKSQFYSISFKLPSIDYIYVTDGKFVNTRHLEILGDNFGADGDVFI